MSNTEVLPEAEDVPRIVGEILSRGGKVVYPPHMPNEDRWKRLEEAGVDMPDILHVASTGVVVPPPLTKAVSGEPYYRVRGLTRDGVQIVLCVSLIDETRFRIFDVSLDD